MGNFRALGILGRSKVEAPFNSLSIRGRRLIFNLLHEEQRYIYFSAFVQGPGTNPHLAIQELSQITIGASWSDNQVEGT